VSRTAGLRHWCCWRDISHNEWILTLGGALATHVELPALDATGPGPFSLAEPRRLRELLDGSGFADVSVTAVAEPMRFGDDIDDVLDFVRDTALARELLADTDEATTRKAFEAIRAALAPHQSPEGVLLGGAAWLVTARRP
jgi:hypothetical protein